MGKTSALEPVDHAGGAAAGDTQRSSDVLDRRALVGMGSAESADLGGGELSAAWIVLTVGAQKPGDVLEVPVKRGWHVVSFLLTVSTIGEIVDAVN